MPGLFEVSQAVPARVVIEDILLIAQCSLPGASTDRVHFLPLQ